MKKKTLETVSFLKAKKQAKNFDYVAVAAVMDIAGSKHLILDIYTNTKEGLSQPKIRITLNKDDWGNYTPDSSEWDRRQIRDIYNNNIWEKHTEKTYLSEQDERTIESFIKPKYQKWYDTVCYFQATIAFEQRQKTTEKKQKMLEERNSKIPSLPSGFKKWYQETLFKNDNFIYYKRKGRYADFTCSHCGESYRYATQPSNTFEGQFEHIVLTPKNGQKARCEKCDVEAIYKAAGNMKEKYLIKKYCYVIQKIEKEVVIRYVMIKKNFAKGIPEDWEEVEIARNYFSKGVKVQKDYYVCDGWSGRNRWIYTNISGMNNITQREAPIYPESYAELKGTQLEYSGLTDYLKEYDTVEVVKYMEAYQQYHIMEMFSKLGMFKLIEKMINGMDMSNYLKTEEEKPEQILQIEKRHIKPLILKKGDLTALKVFQLEKALDLNWKEWEEQKVIELSPDMKKLSIALKYMTIRQFLNRVEKYSGTEWEAECSHAFSKRRETTILYLDYLEMKQTTGYDLNNSIQAYPKDLASAHQKIVMEINKAEADKRIAIAEEKFSGIKKLYKNLMKKYSYKDDFYCIRPAKTAGEIILEGQTLHHCVGGDSYLEKHNEGKSTILFLRFKDKPKVSYITVEIKDNKIMQWYGRLDKKPDQENMQKWIDAYVNRLLCNHKSEQKEMAG